MLDNTKDMRDINFNTVYDFGPLGKFRLYELEQSPDTNWMTKFKFRGLNSQSRLELSDQDFHNLLASKEAETLMAQGYYPVSGKHLMVARLAFPLNAGPESTLNVLRAKLAPGCERKKVDVDTYVALKWLWRKSGKTPTYVSRDSDQRFHFPKSLYKKECKFHLDEESVRADITANLDAKISDLARFNYIKGLDRAPRVNSMPPILAAPYGKTARDIADQILTAHEARLTKACDLRRIKGDIPQEIVVNTLHKAIKDVQVATREERIERAVKEVWPAGLPPKGIKKVRKIVIAAEL